MLRTFAEDGLSFDYPASWKLQREESDDGWAVTLQSPGAAFALVRLDRSMPDVGQVLGTTLEALRADYPALEASNALETIAGEMAMGHDIEFFSLDMVNTCWTRCFYGPAGTVLILCQASDLDSTPASSLSADYESALHRVCASMRLTEE